MLELSGSSDGQEPSWGSHHLTLRTSSHLLSTGIISFSLLTPIPLPNLSNMQPNFPKWIVITVIHASSSRPFVGGFRCERLCIIFSGALWFENWSHGALLDQLLVGMVFNKVISSLIFPWIQLSFTAKVDCAVSRVYLNLLFVLIVYVTRFIS